MIEPVMVNWSAITGRRFSGTSNPVVPPTVTSVPPRASDDRLCLQESEPTLSMTAPTFLRTTRYPNLETRSPTELNQSGRHAPGGPLNQHRLAPLQSRFGEQGTVGGQPGRSQHGGVQQRKIMGKRDRIAFRHDGVSGEGAVDE